MITRRVSVVIVEFHFAEMTRDHCFANERYYTTCMCCWAFFFKVQLFILSKDSKLYFLLFNFESRKFQIQSYTQSVGYMETLLWYVIRHLLNLQLNIAKRGKGWPKCHSTKLLQYRHYYWPYNHQPIRCQEKPFSSLTNERVFIN